MNHRNRRLAHAGLGIALAIGVLSPALAASQQEESGDEPASERIPVSDRQLERFAAAYNAISPLRRKYARLVQQAETEDEKDRLREEADRDWVRAIEAQGLDVAEFQTIGRELNARRELQERMNDLVRDP